MGFLVRWLGLERPGARVGLRPHAELELPLPYDAAYTKVLEAIDRVLGGSVWLDDRKGGLVEAGFGLVNSERLRCTLGAAGDERTHVRIEAFYPAGAQIPQTSRYVDALAAALRGSDAIETGVTA